MTDWWHVFFLSCDEFYLFPQAINDGKFSKFRFLPFIFFILIFK